MNAKYLVSDGDVSAADVNEIYEVAAHIKNRLRSGITEHRLAGKTLAMIFEKPSNRTRISFEVAMTQLGGHALYLSRHDLQLGAREAVRDAARVVSGYADCVMIRTNAHSTVEEFAAHAAVPVVNGLSDYLHPCQSLSDLFTVLEVKGALKGVRLCFVGDGNNVARSLAWLCSKMGVSFAIASPKGYELKDDFLKKVRKDTGPKRGGVRLFRDPFKAAKGADIVYTDVWTSMGQESETEKRREAFQGYQVNEKLVAAADEDVVVMHCLPAHRGEEITDKVIDSARSIVYHQAENRLHVQKAILKLLMERK